MEYGAKLVDKFSGLVIAVGERVGRLAENSHVGMRRVLSLASEYERKGYFVIVNSNVNDGVDVIAFKASGGRPLVEVVESTNYGSAKWFMKDERFERYVNSLNYYDAMPSLYVVKKKIVVSYLWNLRPRKEMNDEELKARLRECEKNNIEVVVVGHQD